MSIQDALDSLDVAEDAALEAGIPGDQEGVAHLREMLRRMPGELAKRQELMGHVWDNDIQLATYASRTRLEEQGDFTWSFDAWEERE